MQKKKIDSLILFPPEKSVKQKSHCSIKQFLGSTFYSDEEIDSEMFAEFHIPPNIVILKSENKVGIDHIAYEASDVNCNTKIKTRCPECESNCLLINSKDTIGFDLKIIKSKNSKV